MLSSNDVRRLAAAKALEWGQAKGAVAEVQIDGTAVELAEAQAALSEVESFVPPEPGFVDRWADRLDCKVLAMQTKLEGQPMAKKVIDMLNVDHERIAKQVQVDVAFADGRTEQVIIEVVDVATSKLLNLLSAAAELGSATPILGNVVLPLAALAAQVGAQVSAWSGRAELAEALQRIALKESVLAGVGFVPGVGTVTGLLAATRDVHDKLLVQAAPPVRLVA